MSTDVIRDEVTGIRLRLLPAGDLWMGSDGVGSPDEYPRHRVTLTRSIYLAETMTTVDDWARFVADTGYQTDGERCGNGGMTLGPTLRWTRSARVWWRDPLPDHHPVTAREPVTQVSWFDVQAFCYHYRFRLPSEAEWEAACRAGTTTSYWWGDDARGGRDNGNFLDLAATRVLGRRGFEFDDGFAFYAPVGSFAPNPWGFFDMLGNAWEWCLDVHDMHAYAASDRIDPVIRRGAKRVIRGGSWFNGPGYCRCASRGRIAPTTRHALVGFRVARDG